MTSNKKNNTSWKKGQSGNPKGRPANAQVEELRKALEKVGKKKKKDFLIHCVELAYTDTQMAMAILRKLVPDMKEMKIDAEGLTFADLMRAVRGED